MPNTKPKKLLIMIGPQGSGNHLFSKIFASSDKIGGWKVLNDHYWKGYHTEPFQHVWDWPGYIHNFDFNDYDYWVTSASVPVTKDGKLFVINPLLLYSLAQDINTGNEFVYDMDVHIGIITRDINILKHQQQRVRGKETLQDFYDVMYTIKTNDIPFITLSHESLILLGQPYMNQICDSIGFPCIKLDPELLENSNKKYVHPVDSHWLDSYVKLACEESKQNDN
jgi:hypothetical protein